MKSKSTVRPAGRPEMSAMRASPCDSPAVSKRIITQVIIRDRTFGRFPVRNARRTKCNPRQSNRNRGPADCNPPPKECYRRRILLTFGRCELVHEPLPLVFGERDDAEAADEYQR